MKNLLFLFVVLICSCSAETESTDAAAEAKEVSGITESTDSAALELDLLDEAIKELEEAQTTLEDSVEVEYTSEEFDDIDWQEYEESMTWNYSFVIILSSKDYDKAKERAEEAAEKLGYPLDLRGLHPHPESGLSLPIEQCEAICGGDVVEYPQYLPRNDWGEDKYVSVEYSNGFEGFTPGYYIVVVASSRKGEPIIDEALKEARQFYSDAYAKTCGVWMGCGC